MSADKASLPHPCLTNHNHCKEFKMSLENIKNEGAFVFEIQKVN